MIRKLFTSENWRKNIVEQRKMVENENFDSLIGDMAGKCQTISDLTVQVSWKKHVWLLGYSPETFLAVFFCFFLWECS